MIFLDMRSLNVRIFVIVSQLMAGTLISEVISSPASFLENMLSASGAVSEDLVPLLEIPPTILESTTPVVVQLKPSDVELLEVDCTDSMFMSPFHFPVRFTGNGSISKRFDPTCKWNFFGTEPCIPMLSCTEFNLKSPDSSGNCVSEYFEVFDGNTGMKRYCGNSGPENITAAEDLRDLYITFKTERNEDETRKNIFTCSVICSERGTPNTLPTTFTPKVNPRCICGNKPNDDRIVNGDNATKGEFPWIAAIVEANTRQPFCGGSILNDKMILTAGHCIKGKYLNFKNMEVILNGHILDISPNLNNMKTKPKPLILDPKTLNELDTGNGSVRMQVEEIIVHPLYISETNDFDVAILRLKTPINFAKYAFLNPVCLPALGSYMRTFGGRKATIAGWGLPSATALGTVPNLQKLDVNVFSPKECKNFYAHRVNRRMMCAGYAEGSKDSCAGDSGGPLVIEDRVKVWYQIGSVSWGESCALAGNPGVYFRTTESGQWLNYHSNSNDAVWCAVP